MEKSPLQITKEMKVQMAKDELAKKAKYKKDADNFLSAFRKLELKTGMTLESVIQYHSKGSETGLRVEYIPEDKLKELKKK